MGFNGPCWSYDGLSWASTTYFGPATNWTLNNFWPFWVAWDRRQTTEQQSNLKLSASVCETLIVSVTYNQTLLVSVTYNLSHVLKLMEHNSSLIVIVIHPYPLRS